MAGKDISTNSTQGKLSTANGQIIGKSRMYSSAADMETWIAPLKTSAACGAEGCTQ